MGSKIFLIFIFTSSFLIGNPNNPIEITSKISVDVVKPIEILYKRNIYHSVIKGMSKDINDFLELEIKASPNQKLIFSYNYTIPLINESGATINMSLGYLSGADYGTTAIGRNSYRISSPPYGTTRVYHIPYGINIRGSELSGKYQGIIDITINYE